MSEPDAPSDEHWVPLADLMSGMMMLFLLVAVLFMAKDKEARPDKKESTPAAGGPHALAFEPVEAAALAGPSLEAMRRTLHERLRQEFEHDLPRWHARLDGDLTIGFDDPKVLFATGSAQLREPFAKILADFFPRYLRILSDPLWRGRIGEIRIEGHTSSLWAGLGADEAWLRNMALSQERTRATLGFVVALPQLAAEKTWLRQRLTAIGLSSSHPRLNPDGSENQFASQRVEFRVRLLAEPERLAGVAR